MRLVRIPDSSQFIELPYEINLPTNERAYNASVRYIKSLPKFRRSFVMRNQLSSPKYEENDIIDRISTSAQSNSTICDDDSDNDFMEKVGNYAHF
jgi:hypothetical protein